MIVEKSHIELEKKFDKLKLLLDETTETANTSKAQCIQFLSWSKDFIEKTQNKFDYCVSDYTRQIRECSRINEGKLYSMTTSLTTEVQYMNRRLKQRLMYQIGLIDDPWDENEDKVSDKCYSEDSQDPHDFIKFRRAQSADKFDLPKILKGDPYIKLKKGDT